MEQVRPRSSNPDPRRRSSPSSSAASVRSARSRSSRRASKRRSSRSWGDRLKSRIREALYIGLFDALPLLRDPMLLVVISLFSFLPVIFIFVFADAASAMQSLIGAIVLTFSFTGLFASQSVYFNKQWFRFQDMLVASKVSPASYAVGLSVSGLVVALPASELVIGWAYLLGFAAFMGFLASRRAHWVDPEGAYRRTAVGTRALIGKGLGHRAPASISAQAMSARPNPYPIVHAALLPAPS